MNPNGIGRTHGSPAIAPSVPGAEYKPRPDQILAAMRDHKRCFGREISVAEARRVCIKNHAAWRDEVRKWKFVQTEYGTYVQVEDK